MKENILLKPVKTEEEIQIYGKYKVELIKLHQQYAQKYNLLDLVVDQYQFEDAIRHIGNRQYHHYIIGYQNKNVGILEYKMIFSKIDHQKVLYINSIYIEPAYRGKGIGKQVILELKKHQKRIELECWYGMPANQLYQSLGMKEITAHYILDVAEKG